MPVCGELSLPFSSSFINHHHASASINPRQPRIYHLPYAVCTPPPPSMDAETSSKSNNEGLLNLNQLVLYAPLISTRRSASSVVSSNSVSRSNSTRLAPSSAATTQRVPFSWESSPGVPKSLRNSWHDDDPPLPLPPRLRAGEDDGKSGKLQILVNEAYRSSDGSDDDDEIFSDALDEISLSEKFDIACRLSSIDRANYSDVRGSSSFIMKRFLPAASALANSTAQDDAHFSRRLHKEMTKGRIKHRAAVAASPRLQAPKQFDPYAESRRELNSMACGLMLFFPWSLKPTICGYKSPTPRPVDESGSGLRSPARGPTARRNRSATSPKRGVKVKGYSDGWSSDVEDNGGGGDRGGYVGKLSVRVKQSSGAWGLPFLDTSRLRATAREVDKRKATGTATGGARQQRRRNGESRIATGRLPQLTSPSQSWLSQAIASINTRH